MATIIDAPVIDVPREERADYAVVMSYIQPITPWSEQDRNSDASLEHFENIRRFRTRVLCAVAFVLIATAAILILGNLHFSP